MSVATLRALMALQEADTAVDQLLHRRQHLQEQTAISEATTRLANALRAVTAATAARDKVAAEQAAEERTVADIEDRIAKVDSRMRQPGLAPRDVEKMMLDIAHAKERKLAHEDHLLELMEELEPLEETLAEAESTRDAAGREVLEGRAALARGEQAVDAELAPAESHRARMAEHVPDELMAIYTKLRQRFGGQGAAWLDGNRCTGCHLTMSPAELDAYSRQPADAPQFCDSCGRILVRR